MPVILDIININDNNIKKSAEKYDIQVSKLQVALWHIHDHVNMQ
jgi:hypothetical protein